MEMSVESIRALVDSDSPGPIEANCRPAIRWLLEEVARLAYLLAGAEDRAVQLTLDEGAALDASVRLSRAMRKLLVDGSNAESDWLEIASRIHDLQSRILMAPAARAGHGRLLGDGL